MRIALLIPDRGDRPDLMQQCLRMMAAQTLPAQHIEVVDDPPSDDKKDITKRYRMGYDRLRNRGFDLIAFIENDDWYHPRYLEEMVKAWKAHGCPQIFGTNYTIYYHLGLRRWFVMDHHRRSSAMSTFIQADLLLTWPQDHDPYTDLHLWMHNQLQGVTFRPEQYLCMGMKHGMGLCGGNNHTNELQRYVNPDPEMQLLREHMDADSFSFYQKLSRQLCGNTN